LPFVQDPAIEPQSIWGGAGFRVILATELLPILAYTHVRDVLADKEGVWVYRNGFRVVPYGDQRMIGSASTKCM